MKFIKDKIAKIFNRNSLDILVELFYANLKARDQNSILGILWGLLGPLALLLIMYLIFRYKFGSNIAAYPLYIFIGIILTNFFITLTGYSLSIFSSYRDFTLNSIVPRELLVLSNILIHGYKFIVEMLFCTFFSIYLGLFSIKSFILLFPLLLSFTLMLLGIIFILSTIYCFSRDISHVWGLISRLLFFATPIFYKLESLPGLGRTLIFYCNPITPFLVSFQHIFLHNGNVQVFPFLYSHLLGITLFAIGYTVFAKFEYSAMEKA